MGRSLQQTSISTNIKERLDFSCALFAPDGTWFYAPTSVSIFEEGAEIVSFKIVNGGIFDREGLIEYMVDKPSQYPGSSGCRNIRDVESDLKATLTNRDVVVDDYGLETVQEYMYHIRANAEQSVRNLLKDVARRAGTNVLEAIDYLDDGSPIQLKVDINVEKGSAVLDFTGQDARSLLSPSRTAAVCGGNVLTSQRIVDVVLKAFHACAASQGCTKCARSNRTRTILADEWTQQPNVWHGWEGQGRKQREWMGILRSGSGAGPGWHGTSGVHTHITNTRIGDVEILERRYPVMLNHFGLRTGSAGQGKYHGGEGVIRDIEFMEPMQVSILSEVSLGHSRSSDSLTGRENSAANETALWHGRRWARGSGRNTWVKKACKADGDLVDGGPTERNINIGGKASVWMGKGDRLLIETPGGVLGARRKGHGETTLLMDI
ncbi:Hydantoinase B/oxoprolinase [Salix suchowensis]|nr:Hydantoinase B/oxoprolinase [Salix suchowensis]